MEGVPYPKPVDDASPRQPPVSDTPEVEYTAPAMVSAAVAHGSQYVLDTHRMLPDPLSAAHRTKPDRSLYLAGSSIDWLGRRHMSDKYPGSDTLLLLCGRPSKIW